MSLQENNLKHLTFLEDRGDASQVEFDNSH